MGFEPKTHSLEGCCSIQLSYRTDPFLLLALRGSEVKSGCKDSDYFLICNMACEIFWRQGFGEALASEVRSPEAEVRSQESGNWRQKSGCFPARDELACDLDDCDEEEADEGENDCGADHWVDVIDVAGDRLVKDALCCFRTES